MKIIIFSLSLSGLPPPLLLATRGVKQRSLHYLRDVDRLVDTVDQLDEPGAERHHSQQVLGRD